MTPAPYTGSISKLLTDQSTIKCTASTEWDDFHIWRMSVGRGLNLPCFLCYHDGTVASHILVRNQMG